MKKTFFKNLFRDIKKTISRFLSIVVIIAVGVSFYAGVRATSPDMKKSGDYYFDKNNLMDFKIISTLGLTDDDVEALKKVKGVTEAEGSRSLDAVVIKDNRAQVLNVDSLPKANGINKITIVSGRTAENDNEAVVEKKFLDENKLKIGDTIELQSGNSSNIKDKLKNNVFKIVGAAESPLYVSAQRQLSSVGNGTVKGFVYILPDVFKSDVFTEIYIRCSSKVSENSLTDNAEYKAFADNIETELKTLGLDRCDIRYAQVLQDANDEIKSAEDKLNKSEKEAADGFAEGQRKLDAAAVSIAQGKAELSKNQTAFTNGIKAGEKEIADGLAQLQAAEKELDSKAQELDKGKLQAAQAEKQLEDSEKQLSEQKQQAAAAVSAAVEEKVAEAKALLDSDPENPEYQAEYDAINGIYEKDIQGKDFDSMYAALEQDGALDEINSYFDIKSLKSTFDSAQAGIDTGRQQLAAQEKQLNDGEKLLEEGRTELEVNKKKIETSQTELNKQKQEGQQGLKAAAEKLQQGQAELDENTAKLKAEKQKAASQFKDAENEIQSNKDKLADIKKPDWYILGRSENVGYETYRQDSDRIDNIGKAFPLIFFLVAALVSLTTMTRMVEENRIEVGTFKALGYSTGAIVAHYLLYSMAASLIGSLAGISFGFRLFPPLIIKAYGSLYTIPDSITPFNTGLAFMASFIAVLFTTAAAVAATLGELKETPASLMRPKAPKSGKGILLEKIPFIWRKLTFTQKVTARNLFRYKQRFFMTVIGIAACTALMITGFGLKGGIVGAAENQFSKIYRYDMQVSLNKNIEEKDISSIEDEVMKDANTKSVLFSYTKNGTAKGSNPDSQDVYVVVPENKEDINKYIDLTMNGRDLRLGDDGVILSQKLSGLIGKKIGDTLELTVDNKTVKVKVSAITEHYVQHYVYMSPAYYEKLMGKKPQFNNFYGLLKSTSESAENSTSGILAGISNIGSISFKNHLHIDFNKSVDSINSVVLILIVSAGVLAFVVIYNLTNININERKRELATIKLLGFFNDELAMYIYRENIILTIVGSLAGMVLGKILDVFIVSTAETNVMMFLKTIKPEYYLYSVVLTIIFSVVVNVAMYSRFDRIDMIESLKSAE